MARKTALQLEADVAQLRKALAAMKAKNKEHQQTAAFLVQARKRITAQDLEIAELKGELADRREQVRVLAHRLKQHED